jgi:hypothetical protein
MKKHSTMRLTAAAPLVAGLVIGCSAASESPSTTEPGTNGAVQTGGSSNTDGLGSQTGGAGTGDTITGTDGNITGTGGIGTGGTDPGTGGTIIATGGTGVGGDPGTGGDGTGSTIIATGGTGVGGDPGTGGDGTGGDGVGGDPGTGGDPGSGGTDSLGPENGDPNAPFSIPEVACGGPEGPGWSPSANHEIGGRGYLLTYPCNKGAGAPMTFFLLLHGTTPPEQHFYIHNFYSIHNYSESHNIIVATPGSVVEQWGNGDGGQDEPHLMEIIDWVYATFHGDGKFDIRGMWVGGHSWGAMYTSTFACKDELADKIVGAFPMGGMGRQVACADRISILSAAAEDDIGPVVDQGDVPASNGCGAPIETTLEENIETLWPDCDPGFVYANYFMLGKVHESPIDDIVVARTADLIKGARI